MPPKKATSTSAAAAAAGTTSTFTPKKPSTKPSKNPVAMAYTRYIEDTPQRTKLLDAFLGFLVVVGVLQFVYCVIAGNYPFNAFLSGFSATVGQFVLTVSLRMQTNLANKGAFGEVSPERAFADFVFGSLILHFFCVHFIN
ncbi:defender against death DAD protein [Ascodesmis nigricans]|uniref:Dolichyl-diphosphooligosaccharide--protein glycosyltransferase subunit OST2 n=1 Tax=Ascodesmis nigricans TaxID=341454 RepID=A0A4S2N4Z8_9PEZI|nr:defender against death DAD protein [Ascodesmis nigricans]